jgi:hypothetical protein
VEAFPEHFERAGVAERGQRGLQQHVGRDHGGEGTRQIGGGDGVLNYRRGIARTERTEHGPVGPAGRRQQPRALEPLERAPGVGAAQAVDFARRKPRAIEQHLQIQRSRRCRR